MVAVGLLVMLDARPGEEGELAAFLTGALPLARAEPETTAWFGIKFDASTFGIVDVFPGCGGPTGSSRWPYRHVRVIRAVPRPGYGARPENRLAAAGRQFRQWRPRTAEMIRIWHRRRPSVTAAPGVRTTGTDPRWAALIRWAAGAIFLIFGTAEFSGHAAELTSLRHYALQDPDVFVSLVGALRVAGGLLLVIGLLTRLAALALAAERPARS